MNDHPIRTSGRILAVVCLVLAALVPVPPDTGFAQAGPFSGKYTEYGSTRPHSLYPFYDNREEIFEPASPSRIVGIDVDDRTATIGPAEDGGVSLVWKRKGIDEPFTLALSGELPLGDTVFRLYASESGAEHIVVSPDGDVVYLWHTDGKRHGAVFFDRGDTRRERNAQMSGSPGRCPAPSFPLFAEVSKWCFAQPVRAIRPPPGNWPPADVGGGIGGGGGGGLCPTCHGKGTTMVYSNPHGTRGPYFCGECGGSNHHSHYHQRCFACGGTGRR